MKGSRVQISVSALKEVARRATSFLLDRPRIGDEGAACTHCLVAGVLRQDRSRSDRQPAAIVCCRGALWRLQRRIHRQPAVAACGGSACRKSGRTRISNLQLLSAGRNAVKLDPAGIGGPQPGGGGGPQFVAELARTPQAATRIVACSRGFNFHFSFGFRYKPPFA